MHLGRNFPMPPDSTLLLKRLPSHISTYKYKDNHISVPIAAMFVCSVTTATLLLALLGR